MRRIARTDSNQKEVIEALRKAGCSVVSLHQVGGGVPDLLVSKLPKTWLIEVKSENGDLTLDQIKFHKSWQGDVFICRSVEEALKTIR